MMETHICKYCTSPDTSIENCRCGIPCGIYCNCCSKTDWDTLKDLHDPFNRKGKK